MRNIILSLIIVIEVLAQGPGHPLDDLTTGEYWTIYETLQKAGHATPETMFASVLLHAPLKASVLNLKAGQAFAREADVVLLRGDKSFIFLALFSRRTGLVYYFVLVSLSLHQRLATLCKQ